MTDPTVIDVLVLMCSPVLLAFFAGAITVLAWVKR